MMGGDEVNLAAIADLPEVKAAAAKLPVRCNQQSQLLSDSCIPEA